MRKRRVAQWRRLPHQVRLAAKAITAIRTFRGFLSIKVFAAAVAAASRLGAMSVAPMLRATSIARMIVRASGCRVLTIAGRAIATSSAISARQHKGGGNVAPDTLARCSGCTCQNAL